MKITKILSVLAIVLCLYHSSIAQFTIKAGFTYSDISYHSVINANLYDPAVGFTGGVFYSNMLNRNFGLETGVTYFSIGAVKSASGNFDWRHGYIGIPFIISIQPTSFMSPGAGFMFSKKISSDKIYEDLYDNTLDMSGVIRLNINLFANLGFEMGYNHGFIPFSKVVETNTIGEIINTANYTNRHLYLTVNLRL